MRHAVPPEKQANPLRCRTAAGLSLSSAIAVVLATGPVGAEDRQQTRENVPQTPDTTIYGDDSRRYGGPNYNHLRPPYGPQYGYGMPQYPDMRMQGPRSGIYGPDSRSYGGPNYSGLRPGGGPSQGQPYGGDVPIMPDTSIYGRDSRMYGGPNYSRLQPGQMPRTDERPYRGYGDPRGNPYQRYGYDPRYGGDRGYGRGEQGGPLEDTKYENLQPDDRSQGSAPRTVDQTPDTGITGEDSRQYGGPNYDRLEATASGGQRDAGSQRAGSRSGDADRIPDTTIYGRDSGEYGASDYGNIRPGNRQ